MEITIMVGSHHAIPKDPRGNWSQLPATILIGPETSWMLFCGAFIRFFYQNFGGFTLADKVVKTPRGKGLTCEKGCFLGHYLEEPEVRLEAVGGLWRVCGEGHTMGLQQSEQRLIVPALGQGTSPEEFAERLIESLVSCEAPNLRAEMISKALEVSGFEPTIE